MPALPIGGFMPIPLAMMIPFMAAQSIIMGDAFGKGYQFGKRKISAMTNEEFNSLSQSDLISEMQKEFKEAIPSIKQSLSDSTELQTRIVGEMLRILPALVTAGTKTLAEEGKALAGEGQEMLEKLSKFFSQGANIPQAFGQTAVGPPPPSAAPLRPSIGTKITVNSKPIFGKVQKRETTASIKGREMLQVRQNIRIMIERLRKLKLNPKSRGVTRLEQAIHQQKRMFNQRFNVSY